MSLRNFFDTPSTCCGCFMCCYCCTTIGHVYDPLSQAASNPSSQAASNPSSQAAPDPSSQAAPDPSSQAASDPSSQAAPEEELEEDVQNAGQPDLQVAEQQPGQQLQQIHVIDTMPNIRRDQPDQQPFVQPAGKTARQDLVDLREYLALEFGRIRDDLALQKANLDQAMVLIQTTNQDLEDLSRKQARSVLSLNRIEKMLNGVCNCFRSLSDEAYFQYWFKRHNV